MSFAAMRSKHSDDDDVTIEDIGGGESRLTCTDGWVYTANNEFVNAVVARHVAEANLSD